jgi:NAD(P)-dependent dehydrogenase (short-subunit alcohol dehydrogenase family)
VKLVGKVAIVTGGTSGIGRAIAIAFAREGAKVAVVGRDRQRLAQVEQEIKGGGEKYLIVPGEMRKLSEIDRVVQTTVKEFGKLDILVNSAGVFELCDFLETSEDFFDRTIDLNLKSLFFMIQRAAKEMKNQGKGKIVSMASIGGGTVGFPTASVYCASKGAIVSLTQTLALELAPYKINVNAISPGNIRTPMNEHLLANPDYLKAMLDHTPWGRIGETKDIIPAAIYLASDDSDYVTGIQLVVDGGWSCP